LENKVEAEGKDVDDKGAKKPSYSLRNSRRKNNAEPSSDEGEADASTGNENTRTRKGVATEYPYNLEGTRKIREQTTEREVTDQHTRFLIMMRVYSNVTYSEMVEAMNLVFPGDSEKEVWTTNLIAKTLGAAKGTPEFEPYWQIMQNAKLSKGQPQGLSAELREEANEFFIRLENCRHLEPMAQPMPVTNPKPKPEGLRSKSSLSIDSEKDRECPVKGIRNSRLQSKQWQYLVDWEDSWNPSWEQFSMIGSGTGMLEAIKTFHEANPDKPKPTQRLIPILYE
jgi:hypothetical protein